MRERWGQCMWEIKRQQVRGSVAREKETGILCQVHPGNLRGEHARATPMLVAGTVWEGRRETGETG